MLLSSMAKLSVSVLNQEPVLSSDVSRRILAACQLSLQVLSSCLQLCSSLYFSSEHTVQQNGCLSYLAPSWQGRGNLNFASFGRTSVTSQRQARNWPPILQKCSCQVLLSRRISLQTDPVSLGAGAIIKNGPTTDSNGLLALLCSYIFIVILISIMS